MVKFLASAIALACLVLPPIAGADVRFSSWNIKHFGWNNDKAEDVVAAVASGFDLVAIQELMDADALERMERNLESITGESWSQMASHEVGRGRYKEMYGFIWRDSEVEYLDGAVVYLDSKDVFIREPYSARFLDVDTNISMAVATVHVLFGDSVSDRTPEIQALRSYWDWLLETYPEDADRLMLAGDFNLPPDHEAWAALKLVAKPLITRGKTTLSTRNGRYASLYDNIWVSHSTQLDHRISGIFRLTDFMDAITGRHWNNDEIRGHVSDHVPVFSLLGAQDIPVVSLKRSASSVPAPPADRRANRTSCVDINRATLPELERIPYIGDKRSGDIVSGRPWKSLDNLDRIKGIGPATLRKIKASGVVCPI